MSNVTVSTTDLNVSVAQTNLSVSVNESNNLITVTQPVSNVSVTNTTLGNIVVSEQGILSNVQIRNSLSVVDTGYDLGSLTYSNATGIFTFVGINNAEITNLISNNPANVRTALSNTSPITYNASTGVIGLEQTLDDLTLVKWQETIIDGGNVSGAINFDIAQGTIHTCTLVNDVTNITLSNISSGGSATLFLKQDGIGGHTMNANITNWNWTSDYKTLDTSPSAENVINLIYDGTYYYASLSEFNGNISETSNIVTTGNITASHFIGNGSELTGMYGNTNVISLFDNYSNIINTSANIISTSNIIIKDGAVDSAGFRQSGNVFARHATFGTTGSVNGNISAGNISLTGKIGAQSFEGNGSLLTGIVASKAEQTQTSALSGSFYQRGLTAGQLVAISTPPVQAFGGGDSVTSSPQVHPADAGNIQHRAFGISTVTTTNYLEFQQIITSGTVTGLDISEDFRVGDTLYMSTTAGEFSNVAPTFASNVVIQQVGFVVEPASGGNSNGRVFLDIRPANQVDVTTTANIHASGNISGNFILGDGSQLSNLPSGISNAQAQAFIQSNGLTMTSAISSNSNVTTTANTSAVHGTFTGATGITVTGNASIGGNLNVTGNINSETVVDLFVEDRNITLGYGTTGAPSANSQIIIDRGSSANTYLKWDEGTDKWKFSNNGSTEFVLPESTTDLAEGTNQYFTNTRSRGAVSVTQASASGAGTLAYDNGTGVFTYTPPDLSSFGTSSLTNAQAQAFIQSSGLSMTANVDSTKSINLTYPDTVLSGIVVKADSPGSGTTVLDVTSARSGDGGPQNHYKKSTGTIASPGAIGTRDYVLRTQYYGHDGTDYINTFGSHVYQDSDVGGVSTDVVPLAYEIYTDQAGDHNDGFIQSIVRYDSNRNIIFNDTGTRTFGNGQGNANITQDGTINTVSNINATGNITGGNILGTFVGGGAGITGLTTSIVSEGTNQYFTNTRSRAAISTTNASASGGGALAYDNGTGVFTFTPAVPGIALTDLSVSTATPSGNGSLSYNNGTGVFTFTPADASGGGGISNADAQAFIQSNGLSMTANIDSTKSMNFTYPDTILTGLKFVSDTASSGISILDVTSARSGDGGPQNIYRKATGSIASPGALGTRDYVRREKFFGHDGTDYLETMGTMVYQDSDVGSVSTNVVPLAYEIYTEQGGDVNHGFNQSIVRFDADRNIIFNDTGTRTFGNGNGNANITMDGTINTVSAINATGNITGNYILGDGSQLTNLPGGGSGISNAQAQAFIQSNGLAMTANVTSNKLITTTSDISGANVTATATLESEMLNAGSYTMNTAIYGNSITGNYDTIIVSAGNHEPNLVDGTPVVIADTDANNPFANGSIKADNTFYVRQNTSSSGYYFLYQQPDMATISTSGGSYFNTTNTCTFTFPTLNVTANVTMGPDSAFRQGSAYAYNQVIGQSLEIGEVFNRNAQLDVSGDTTITNYSGNAALTLVNNRNDSAIPTQIVMKQNKNGGFAAGLAGDKLSVLQTQGMTGNVSAGLKTYANVVASIRDANDGAEEGQIDFRLMTTGTETSTLLLKSNEANITVPLYSTSNVSTSGKFIGDGSLLTNVTGASTNSFGTITVSGQTNVQASQANAQVEIAAGAGIQVTTSGNTVTIAGSGGSYGNTEVANFLDSNTMTANVEFTGSMFVGATPSNANVVVTEVVGKDNGGTVSDVMKFVGGLIFVDGTAITPNGFTGSPWTGYNGNTYYVKNRNAGNNDYLLYADSGLTTIVNVGGSSFKIPAGGNAEYEDKAPNDLTVEVGNISCGGAGNVDTGPTGHVNVGSGGLKAQGGGSINITSLRVSDFKANDPLGIATYANNAISGLTPFTGSIIYVTGDRHGSRGAPAYWDGSAFRYFSDDALVTT